MNKYNTLIADVGNSSKLGMQFDLKLPFSFFLGDPSTNALAMAFPGLSKHHRLLVVHKHCN